MNDAPPPDLRYGTRDALLDRLAEAVTSISLPHPVRVAIDGAPGSGKTTLGDELAAVLRSRGRPAIRASIDDFLTPVAQRYRRGEYSAVGCYRDAHDHAALNRVLLDPLGPGGGRRIRTAVDDHDTGTRLQAPADAVLLFGGSS